MRAAWLGHRICILDQPVQYFLLWGQKQSLDKRNVCGDGAEAECKPVTEAPPPGRAEGLGGGKTHTNWGY